MEETSNVEQEASVADENEISKDDLPPEVAEYITALEDTVEATTEALAAEDPEFAAAVAGEDFDMSDEPQYEIDADYEVEVDVDDVADAVLAKADPAIREMVAKAEARAEQAEAIAKAEREARRDREFVAKAQTLPMISTDSGRLAQLLKAAEDYLDPEDTAELVSILEKANAAIAESNLFAEVGTSVAKSTPSLDAAAAEIRKGAPELTYEQAVARALDTNPDLYDQED